MKYTYQYKALPTTQQKLELHLWLRTCQYWYNRQLGDRFDWWEQNRCCINACPLICHLPQLRDNPSYYSQKKYLPELKTDLVTVGWSSELVDFSRVPANTLQEVCKRVDKAFDRFLSADSNGSRCGKPRFKSAERFRSMVFEGAGLAWHSCSLGGKYLFLKIPKLGLFKVRMHRDIPDAAILKQVQAIKKADGWYVNLRLDDPTVPVPFVCDGLALSWDNALGMDAVLHEADYLATSEGEKLPSLKSFRKSQKLLAKVSNRKSAKKKGSRSRRKLAKREAREHQRIARARRDHAFKTAQKVVRTGKTVFFYENLNLKGLSKRNRARQDEQGQYLPNGQSAKSGLNKSWNDAAFGQFFTILEYIAGKAGAVAIEVNPAYTSQLLAYRDEFIFTDCAIREYWDEVENLLVDRDINAAINIKRVGLDEFPTINRRRGKIIVGRSTTDSTSKEVLSTLRSLGKPTLYVKH
jgi:putative transposase